jgi:DNA-directed RNA polymerase beta' subunit
VRNLHAPQSYETEAELRFLAATQQHIISAQESKPIIVITQDSLVAAFLMTRRDFRLSRGQFMNISMKGERPDGSPLWSPQKIKHIERVMKEHGKKPDIFNGRGLFSLILPDNLNYEKKNGTYPEQPVVKIVKGVFMEGAFDKTTLGAAHGSLIQILNKEYGAKITSNFIDNVQFLGTAWLLVHGFSIGLEDCMITSEDSVSAIKDTLTQCYTKAEGIEATTQNLGIREVRVTASLSQAKDIGMRIAKDAMSPDNNFLVTVHSGAKGDYFNIAQLTGLLGQQNLEGHRVIPALNHGKRTLPHYPFEGMDKETEYESKGFVHNSFIHGLNPMEFFFHAMSGREGVSDKLVSLTADCSKYKFRGKQCYPLVVRRLYGETSYNVGESLITLNA